MDFLSEGLIFGTSGLDAHYILDAVLNNIDQIMNAIPPNPCITDSDISSSNTSSINGSSSDSSIDNIMEYTTDESRLSAFKLDNNAKVELKDNIYISKDTTYRLAQYIKKEDWGRDCINLYKYLDYIFRCQLFSKHIVKFEHLQSKHLIFNSGLQRRCDNAFLFVLATPNFAAKPQKWRVQIGNNGNVNNSFLSKYELLQKLKQSEINIDSEYLCSRITPQRTMFAHSASDAVYNATYAIHVNWEERITTIQERLLSTIGAAAFFDKSCKYLKLSALIEAFDEALSNTKVVVSLNPKLAIPQGFVDSKRRKYRMELLLPLVVKFDGVSYTFALAIAQSTQQQQTYSVKSILTLNMGYSNARLVGCVTSKWLIRQK